MNKSSNYPINKSVISINYLNYTWHAFPLPLDSSINIYLGERDIITLFFFIVLISYFLKSSNLTVLVFYGCSFFLVGSLYLFVG